MKLVVTGHDEMGKSVFSFAGHPPRELHAGSYDLWSTKGAITLPDGADARTATPIGYFPLADETSFKIVSVPPPEAGEANLGGSLPGDVADFFDSDDPGMHTTDTIDYVLILSGSADLELDDGAQERVVAGDVVVQRGTRHAWRVTGTVPLVLGAVLIGAERQR